jgi:Spy/CpxP family protein refolding chaperone
LLRGNLLNFFIFTAILQLIIRVVGSTDTRFERWNHDKERSMKKTPKLRMSLVFLVCAVFAASAMAQKQGKGGNGQPIGGQKGAYSLQLFNELGLDETQAAEVQAIMEAARLMQAEEWTNFQSNMEAIRAETHGSIMEVLDDVQRARFLELQALRSEQWAEGGRGRNRMKGPNGARGGNGGDGTGQCPNPDCPNGDCPNTDLPDGDG